jgi:hypothetical protein
MNKLIDTIEDIANRADVRVSSLLDTLDQVKLLLTGLIIEVGILLMMQ